jgi:hypothetical protein
MDPALPYAARAGAGAPMLTFAAIRAHNKIMLVETAPAAGFASMSVMPCDLANRTQLAATRLPA